MKHNYINKPTAFFITSPLPCPYLDGKYERRLVAELSGPGSLNLNNKLSRVGFRRSHNLAYTPICNGCSACLAVRNVVDDFQPSTSQKRVLRLNKNIYGIESSAKASTQRYKLFSLYQKSRHVGGDMASMDYFDFQALIEETPVDTSIIDFYDERENLVGGCLVDVLEDGLSAVYSYFHPDYRRNSLGSYIILWLIEKSNQLDLPYVYLGYWIQGNQKMAYKNKFQPLEFYSADGWLRLSEKEPK